MDIALSYVCCCAGGVCVLWMLGPGGSICGSGYAALFDARTVWTWGKDANVLMHACVVRVDACVGTGVFVCVVCVCVSFCVLYVIYNYFSRF